MRKEKIWFLVLFLFLMVGMIGCSSGSSSGGSSSTTTTPTTTTTTPTQSLVGTWRNTAGNPGVSLTFNANGTGSISDGHPITSWTLNGSTLNMNIPQPEVFTCTFNADRTVITLVNQSASGETTVYAKV